MSDGIKRRDFLKVMGVSGAGAGLVGCSTGEVEKLIPYVTPPEEITPGVATWYTSTCNECSARCGLWVRTREGRVVKIEGNPDHPISSGGVCSRGHSSLQGLYGPDRFTGPMLRQESGELESITWAEAEQLLADRLGSASSSVFIGKSAGPSMDALVRDFAAAVGADVVQHDGLSDAPLKEASRMAFGRAEVPSFDIENAHFILSFGADFLETWSSPVSYTRQFANSAGVDEHGEKAPFVFVGPRLSLTGMNADEWIPITPGSEGLLALAMANVISSGGRDAGAYADIVGAYTPQTVAQATGISAETITELAQRFGAEGSSVALGTGAAGQHRNATATNLAVLILNAVAGNVGSTVRYDGGAEGNPDFGSLAAAIARMDSGVSVAMVHGCNPAYTTPEAAGFADAFSNADFKVSFASTMDETAALADLILPDVHFLEGWGDARPSVNIYSLQQPAMRAVPNFDAKATGDVLLAVATLMGADLGATTFYERVRSHWATLHADLMIGSSFEALWKETLKSGYLEVARMDSAVTLRTPDRALVFDVPNFDGGADDPVLVVYPSPRFGDGATNGNRPWLLELPDPVSKIAWASWLEIHPHTAEAMGLRTGDVVTVASPHGAVDVPVWLYPGVREDVVALAMGGGHTDAGRYADGNGVNAMDLLPGEAEAVSGSAVYLATRVSITPTGERYRFATTEGSASQDDRHVAPAAAFASLGHAEEGEHEEGGHGELKELQGVGGWVPVETGNSVTAFPEEGAQHGEYANPTERWAMAIDLDKCTGCSACVTSCQAENNVPWVGEGQVAMGRDMGWIRMERYYETVDAGQPGPVDVRFLPMLCQHCGNAPCEPVCPVYATYHSPNGINQQVYNRCVGTRYCANNCPYKVRVFNWYRYTDEIPEPMNMQFNPDVTVRDNGIMEKCSFCVQRVRDAEHLVALEGRSLEDGDVVPACEQSCPADAIVFGNAMDPDSRIVHAIQNERTYKVLDEMVNTQPGVHYLKKVTFHDVASGEH
jgi:anaerobic selenocysteine-containing dehydrogenase/Fe-S-cluster-containing dehydrogenase component